MNDSTAITWPAVVYYPNQPELDTVECATTLSTLSNSAPFFLIDHTGCRFDVQQNGNTLTTKLVEPLDIDQLVSLARGHLAISGHCCVSKFHATSAAEIIDSLVQLDD